MSNQKPKKPNLDAPIDNDTFVHQVTDLDLAVFLYSVGVPVRKDPPFTAARLKNGQIKWVFNFHTATRDGLKSTSELIRDWKGSDKYIADHPNDLLTGAMCALKNRISFLEKMAVVKPWVSFRSPKGRATVMCIEGSRRHANYIAKGWVQCDPFEDQKRIYKHR